MNFNSAISGGTFEFHVDELLEASNNFKNGLENSVHLLDLSINNLLNYVEITLNDIKTNVTYVKVKFGRISKEMAVFVKFTSIYRDLSDIWKNEFENTNNRNKILNHKDSSLFISRADCKLIMS